jgi:catechol 2,3-dioxygenase-like lactoylglutathione lyase family enzyme
MPRLLVDVDVPDLDRAVRFYTAALGLRVGRRLGTDFVELLGAEVPIYLLLAPAATRASPAAAAERAYERHWTPVHLDLLVDDVAAAVDRAVAAGATLEVPIQQHPYGKLAVLGDPFGHGFCLLQLEGPGYDAIATGGGAPAP